MTFESFSLNCLLIEQFFHESCVTVDAQFMLLTALMVFHGNYGLRMHHCHRKKKQLYNLSDIAITDTQSPHYYTVK